jgi:TrmH family RNA methyltransferase
MRDDPRLTDPAYLAAIARQREVRESDGVFLIEGVRFVVSAVDRGADVLSIVVCRELLKSPVGQIIARRHARAGRPLCRLDAAAFRELSILGEPQGIAAIVRQRVQHLPPRPGRGLWVAVERIRSPGNLGTMLRTIAASGAAGLIALGDEPDPFDPRCVRASMGALFHVGLTRTRLTELTTWKHRTRARILGTDASARTDYRNARYDGPAVLMVGSERRGLTERQRAMCDDLVRIPMSAGIDSLNVAVATGLVLYEARRASAR